jgi:hypothetical protein
MYLHDSNTSFPYIPFLIFAFFNGVRFILHLRRRISRAEEMKQFAIDHGLKFIGAQLPEQYAKGLPRGTALWARPRNVVFGDIHGELVLAFDMSVVVARHRYSTTYVARRWSKPPRTPLLNAALECHEAGNWRCVHQRHNHFFGHPHELRPEEIEDIWDRLESRSASGSNVFIRPRHQQPAAQAGSPTFRF